jgi:hypothetical protein
MKQPALRRLIALLATSAVFLCATPSATAQKSQADISGQWRFKSSLFEDDCTMTGTISFVPAKSGAFACSFVIETSCKYNTDRMQEYWRVSQTCVAKKTGDRVQITSRIGQIEAASYFGAPHTTSARAAYMPDNFDLRLNSSGAEMTGHLFDPSRKVPMRLWREGELLS